MHGDIMLVKNIFALFKHALKDTEKREVFLALLFKLFANTVPYLLQEVEVGLSQERIIISLVYQFHEFGLEGTEFVKKALDGRNGQVTLIPAVFDALFHFVRCCIADPPPEILADLLHTIIIAAEEPLCYFRLSLMLFAVHDQTEAMLHVVNKAQLLLVVGQKGR